MRPVPGEVLDAVPPQPEEGIPVPAAEGEGGTDNGAQADTAAAESDALHVTATEEVRPKALARLKQAKWFPWAAGAVGGALIGGAAASLIFGLIITPSARDEANAAGHETGTAEGLETGFSKGKNEGYASGLVSGKQLAIDEQAQMEADAATAAAEAEEKAAGLISTATTICNTGKKVDLAGDGKSAMIDSKNEDDQKGVDAIVCMNMMLSAPDSLASKMSNTTAMAGNQSMSWGSYSATWSFHPKNGLDVIYEYVG